MQSLILCELAKTQVPGLESYSPFCLKVHRALKLARLPYESKHGGRPASWKHLNPAGQVPVLLVDDRPVSDSTLILAEIQKLAPTAFALESDRLNAEAWCWEEFADTTLNGFLVSARWADDRNWQLVSEAYFGQAPWFVKKLIAPRQRSRVIGALVARDVWRAGSERCWARFDNILDQLEARAPESGYWLGKISVADIAIFAQLHSLRTDLTPSQRESLASRRALSSYLDRVDASTRGSLRALPVTSTRAA